MRRFALLFVAAVLPASSLSVWTGERWEEWGRSSAAPSRYEVQLAFTGYTGLAKSADCEKIVNLKGYDSLIGIVAGVETPNQPDEEVVYYGTARRVTRIDYCETRGRRSANDDEQVWCRATLTGAAKMQVKLTVYGEQGSGALLQATPDTASRADSVKVTGTCGQATIDSIRAEYPNSESGGSPDGQPIAETTPPRFIINRIPRLRLGYFPPDTGQGGWGLRVVRGPI